MLTRIDLRDQDLSARELAEALPRARLDVATALAARVPAPLFYADNPNSKRLRAKTNIILKRMGSAELPEE